MPFSSLTLKLKDLWETTDLELVLSKNWASSIPEHRQQIRNALYQITNDPQILNLDFVPMMTTDHTLSISHNKDFGGYLIARGHTKRVGFDIELVSRCRPEMVLRVSSQEELQKAPSAAALWCAKEAVFKSLPIEQQPSSISALVIQEWIPLEPQIWAFKTNIPHHDHQKNSGLVFELLGQCLAFYRFTCRT